MHITLPPPDPSFLASPGGWPLARVLIDQFAALYGAPAELVLRGLPRAARAPLLAFIRLIEALVRRLLLIETWNLPVAFTPRTMKPANNAGAGIRARASDNPANWRVSPRLFPAWPTGSGRRGAAPAEERLISNRALAERLEALIRVAADPAPYAQRLARRLPRKLVRRLYEPWPDSSLERDHLVEPAQVQAVRVGHGLGPRLRVDTS